MPPSQLKQLKASLRDQGLVGPQKSKKERKRTAKDSNKKLQRNDALQGIRERFNPFEVRAPARKDKFDVISSKILSGKTAKGLHGRPGVTKGLGEERRRATLLREIQSRNKIGGILDRRFGENDPTMTPEQRAAERFARQSEKRLKRNSMFNLEDDEEAGMLLTHGGQSLPSGDENQHDEFGGEEEDRGDSDEEEIESGDGDRPLKRRRLSDSDQVEDVTENGAEQLPERKKTKQEVMKEVIAKSKLYKYERQQAKDDDDDLRAELDKGLPEFYEAMQNHRLTSNQTQQSLPEPKSDPSMNPDRAALLAGKDRQEIEKDYNERVWQMAMDARCKPSDRTKTSEEKIAEEAERLKDMERKRLRRMRGEPETSDEEADIEAEADGEIEQDDAEAFGLGHGHSQVEEHQILDVEDEDDFILDDDLIASGSEPEMAGESDSEASEDDAGVVEDDGDDDFINGLVLPETSLPSKGKSSAQEKGSSNPTLAFTYACPETHEEFLEIVQDTDITNLPIIVQRIRALHHPKLANGNKAKLERFCAVLTEHVAYLANQDNYSPFQVIESLLRHLHSLAKSHPEAVGSAFRAHLRIISEERPLHLNSGDLIILTGVGTIFPTSDHFHSVVTPASLTLGRYLGQSAVQSLCHLATGAYASTLVLQYQNLSHRYMPELITYVTNAASVLAPIAVRDERFLVPSRPPPVSLRIKNASDVGSRALTFRDLKEAETDSSFKIALLATFVHLLESAAELWKDKTAFYEIFEPPVCVLEHLLNKASSHHLPPHLASTIQCSLTNILNLRTASMSMRKPLLLHDHRPLAIKTAIPKFEESFNPDRHYDPDRERSELNKLRAEHKRERKGAMRELRKDANFVARESLRAKKEKDAEYDKKYKRLVAEIQGEEGREANEYEREKRKREGGK